MGVENGIFWSELGSGFGEPGGTPPPRIPRSTSNPKTSSHPSVYFQTLKVEPGAMNTQQPFCYVI